MPIVYCCVYENCEKYAEYPKANTEIELNIEKIIRMLEFVQLSIKVVEDDNYSYAYKCYKKYVFICVANKNHSRSAQLEFLKNIIYSTTKLNDSLYEKNIVEGLFKHFVDNPNKKIDIQQVHKKLDLLRQKNLADDYSKTYFPSVRHAPTCVIC